MWKLDIEELANEPLSLTTESGEEYAVLLPETIGDILGDIAGDVSICVFYGVYSDSPVETDESYEVGSSIIDIIFYVDSVVDEDTGQANPLYEPITL